MTAPAVSSGTVRGRRASFVAGGLVATSFLLIVAGAVLHVLDRHLVHVEITDWWVTNAVAAVGLGLPGALVASRRSRNPIGWILLAVSLGHSATLASREYALHAAIHGEPGAAWAAWIGNWAWLDIGLLSVVFVLFPDGRVRGARWLVVGLAALGELLAAGGNAVFPGPVGYEPPLAHFANPVGWAWAGPRLERLGYDTPAYLLVAASALGLAAMLARLRGAEPVLRRQILVVAPAGAVFVAELAYEVNGDDRIGVYTATVVTALLAASVAAAILRYGLYEIDLVVNRTIVYTILSAGLAGAYLATVAVAQLLVGGGLLASLLGAALVATLFAPLRTQLQSAADRLLYGQRSDPYAVIASLGARLGDAPSAADVLPALAETVARTLKLPYVAIELDRGGTLDRAAEVGRLRGEPLVLPLEHAGGPVGRLALGPRTPSDPFSRAEVRLFGDIARQVAVAAFAARLTEELQASRERLVTAREEERRRLRRDLHDGLGPTLAGMTLQLGSARTLLQHDVAAADALLERLVADTQSAIADVRRLVYDLRPPALDELGLVPALRQEAQRFAGLEVAVEASELAPLPAAVEVAAYRIATEALTNAARHAGAGRCTVRLSLNGALELEVADDGIGIADGAGGGVGLGSMRERAAELGGTCSLTRGPDGGTVVRARLPVGHT